MRKCYRIFHLIKSLGRGGAEVLLEEGLPFADRNQFTYGYGYFLPWKNAVVSSLREKGGEVVCFDSGHVATIALSIPRVAKFLKSWGADLVHCHLPLAGVVGRMAARRSPTGVVYTEHNVMERYHPWTRRANLITWKWQDWVVAVSQEVNNSIQSHAGNAVPVSVIPNGISALSFIRSSAQRDRIRRQWGIPDNAPIVGIVAVFRPQKDLHTWLQAAQLIRNRKPETHFLLVGDGVLRRSIELASASMGLGDCIHFVGLQNDVSPYLSAMDLYLNSSIFEGLPISLLEAMAMYLPVVAASVGGVPEIIVEGRTGFLVPPKQPEALAEKSLLLLMNPEMRVNFGMAGRAVVEERFSMKRMVQQLEELYLRVLEKRAIAS